MKEKIKSIVYEEFSKLISNIEADFKDNYQKKTNNFLLNQLDEQMTANMVFVSSFESKSGFALEACAKRIAILKFGKENVPSIINPRHLPHDIDPPANGQIVVTDINMENGELKGKITEFRADNVASGRGRTRNESQVTQASIKDLLEIAAKYKDGLIHAKPVDLAFFDGDSWNLLELKAGGDLDSSNAPSNVEKLLTIYAVLNVPNSKLYFATLYNKDGEGNTWTGAVKKHLAYPEMFLVGSDFWNKILPSGIGFETFSQIYKEALSDLDLNQRIKKMIKGCLKET
jgi:hypothetical protein